jgi:excisionase family DNA binding protein
MAVDPDRLLTVSEAAARAGVSEKTVRREIDRGALIATRIGRCVRISPEAYRTWSTNGRPRGEVGTAVAVAVAAPATGEAGSLARLRAIEDAA